MYILFFGLIAYLIILLNLFMIFFFFNISKLQVLLDLKILNSYNFFSISVILIFLSLAGMPPLLGFISKFLLLLVLFAQSHFFFIVIFFILNLFMIYFYIQNLRFLLRKSNLNLFMIVLNYPKLSYFSFNLINFIHFFNFFAFFCFENFILMFANLLVF